MARRAVEAKVTSAEGEATGDACPLTKAMQRHSIEEISTIRLLAPVRVMRNYLPFVNMEKGYIKKDWPDEAIYVGKQDGK